MARILFRGPSRGTLGPAPVVLLSSMVGAVFMESAACTEVPQFSEQVSRSSTVPLDGETRLSVDSALPIVLSGNRRTDALTLELEATVTASTSTRAKRLAEALQVAVSHPDDGTVALSLEAPEEAGLEGLLTIELPSDLDVEAVERGGTADLTGVEGHISVQAFSHVRITGARRDTRVRVQTGNVLVSSQLEPGTTTELATGSGDIELTAPLTLSASIEAATQGAGMILIAHPALPAHPGGDLPYRTVVNGGLAAVRLLTGTGRILIRSP